MLVRGLMWGLGAPLLVLLLAPRISEATASAGASAEDQNASTKILVKNLARNFASDQKQMWSFPAELARGRHWESTLAFTAATAGLVALDAHDTPYFRRTNNFRSFNPAFSGRNTGLGMVTVPAMLLAGGWARRDSYTEQTSLLAAEAVADGELLSLVMKDIDRRLRPSDISPSGDFSRSWFRSHGTLLTAENAGFPSGHTIAAFSIAAVFASRYRRHRWVAPLAYTLAAVVGFSRVTNQAHFPSDVFAGAVMGYVVSHYIVLRR